MPVCKKCKKFSNCLTVDFCEHCGAKDWDTWDTPIYRPATSSAANELTGCFTGLFTGLFALVGGALLVLLYIVFLLGGLWLLVAVVKWMWEHS